MTWCRFGAGRRWLVILLRRCAGSLRHVPSLLPVRQFPNEPWAQLSQQSHVALSGHVRSDLDVLLLVFVIRRLPTKTRQLQSTSETSFATWSTWTSGKFGTNRRNNSAMLGDYRRFIGRARLNFDLHSSLSGGITPRLFGPGGFIVSGDRWSWAYRVLHSRGKWDFKRVQDTRKTGSNFLTIQRLALKKTIETD